jgi:hypothetical protein
MSNRIGSRSGHMHRYDAARLQLKNLTRLLEDDSLILLRLLLNGINSVTDFRSKKITAETQRTQRKLSRSSLCILRDLSASAVNSSSP